MRLADRPGSALANNLEKAAVRKIECERGLSAPKTYKAKGESGRGAEAPPTP
jgi:hypothetical protein